MFAEMLAHGLRATVARARSGGVAELVDGDQHSRVVAPVRDKGLDEIEYLGSGYDRW